MALPLLGTRRKPNLPILVLAGFAAGCILGYVFMGTMHAMMEVSMATDNTGVGTAKASSEDAKVTKQWDTIHTLCTSNGSPYLNFQNRIMYATYQMVQKMPGGEKMVGFTRILHRTQPDVLMDEVPTFRADPLTPSCDTWCEFPVSDRPNAVRQFLDAASEDPSLIQAPWLFMIETDYVWMRPLRAPDARDASQPSLAFHYGYIQCQNPDLKGVMRKMYPESAGPLSDLPDSGPAPVLMRVEDWQKVTPDWERLAAHIEADPESKQKLGWVREMYGFSVAVALQKLKFKAQEPPASPLMVQPPADHTLGDAALFHYTWGTLFLDAAGNKVWEFDKRAYTDPSIETRTPKIPPPPPLQQGWKLQDGIAVDSKLYAEMQQMIGQMNKAVDALPLLD